VDLAYRMYFSTHSVLLSAISEHLQAGLRFPLSATLGALKQPLVLGPRNNLPCSHSRRGLPYFWAVVFLALLVIDHALVTSLVGKCLYPSIMLISYCCFGAYLYSTILVPFQCPRLWALMDTEPSPPCVSSSRKRRVTRTI